MRLFLARAFGTLLALAAILELLDLLDQASAIVTYGGIAGIGRYIGLRLASMLAAAMPLAVLAGALLTFMRLAGGLEITAMRAAGLGLGRIVRGLLPTCVLLAVLQFLLQAAISPVAERALSSWWVRTMPVQPSVPSRLWLHAQGDLAAIDRVSPDGRILTGLLIVQRAANGDLDARIDACDATWTGGRWRLHDVRIIRPDHPGDEIRSELDWPHGPSPSNMVELAWPVGPQTLICLVATLRGCWSATRGPLFSWTALDTLVVALLDPALMMVLAAPLLLALPRSSGTGLGALRAIGLGLGYLSLAGLLAAMGDAGTLPPIVAAAVPILLFGHLWHRQPAAIGHVTILFRSDMDVAAVS